MKKTSFKQQPNNNKSNPSSTPSKSEKWERGLNVDEFNGECQSTRRRKHGKVDKDYRKLYLAELEKNKKLQARLQALGRKNLELVTKPEAGVIERLVSQPVYQRWQKSKEALTFQYDKSIDEAMAAIAEHMKDYTTLDISTTMARMAGALLAASQATDLLSLSKILSGVLLQHIEKSHIEFLIKEIEGLVSPQASIVADLQKTKQMLVNFRQMTAQFCEVPLYKLFSKVLAVICYSGFVPSARLPPGAIQECVTTWEENVTSEFGSTTFVDTILYIAEYTLDIVEVVKGGGSIRDLILPCNIHSRYAHVLSLRTSFINGQLGNVNLDNDKYYCIVRGLVLDVDRMLMRTDLPQAAKTVYAGYHKNILALEAEIKAATNNIGAKIMPLSVVLFSPPGVGKTTLMEMIIGAVASAGDFESSAEYRCYHSDMSKYDDSHKEHHTIFIDDDAGSKILTDTNRDSSGTANWLKIINNVPDTAHKADLEGKLGVYRKYKFAIATTNQVDLDIPEVLSTPLAGFRRSLWIECRVNDEFKRPGNNMLDFQRVKVTDGIPEPTNEVRFYEWVEQSSDEGEPDDANAEFSDCDLDLHEAKKRLKYLRKLMYDNRSLLRSFGGNDWKVNGFNSKRAMEIKTANLKREIFDADLEEKEIIRKFPALAKETKGSGRDSDRPCVARYGEWMPVQQAISILGLAAREHYAAQKQYVKSLHQLSTAPRCSLCFNVKNGDWCNCKNAACAKLNEVRKGQRFDFNALRRGRLEERDPEDNEAEEEEEEELGSSDQMFEDAMQGEIQAEAGEIINMAMDLFQNEFITYVSKFTFTAGYPLLENAILLSWLRTFQFLLRNFGAIKNIGKWYLVALTFVSTLWMTIGYLYVPPSLYFVLTLLLFFSVVVFLSALKRFIARAVTREIYNRVINGNPVRLAAMFGGASLAIAGIRMVTNLFSPHINAQANLDPKCKADVEARHQEVDQWAKVEEVPYDFPECLETSTLEQIRNKSIANQVLITLNGSDATTPFCGGFLLTNFLLLIPHHFWESLRKRESVPNVSVTWGRNSRGAPRVALTNPVRLKQDGKDTDFVCVRMSKSLTCGSADTYFTDRVPQETLCMMYSLTSDLQMEEREFMWSKQMVTNGTGLDPVVGSKHRLRFATTNGYCMSPIYCKERPSRIIGFHMGGNTANFIGVAFAFTKEDYDYLVNGSRIEPHAVFRDDDVYFEPMATWKGIDMVDPYDPSKRLVAPGQLHKRSVVNFVKFEKGCVDYHCFDKKFRATMHSRVIKTPISETLEECGWPNHFGPPKFMSDRNHAEYFQRGIDGAAPIHPKLIRMAQRDYITPVVEKLKSIDTEAYHMLNINECLNGVAGNRWIKPIDVNTAGGVGFAGQKKKHLDVTYDETGKKNIKATQVVKDKVKELYEKCKNGIMPSTLIKTALKDCPTMQKPYAEKDKVRLFSVFNMCHFFLGKMLFADLLAKLYSIPLMSELLQGSKTINEEWTQIHDHLFQFPEGVFNGDFSKLDVTLSGQIIRGGCTLLLLLAQMFGATEEELRAMETYICDVATSSWIFNGSIFTLDGWNPSGTFLTIIINGLAMSLLHRIAYYHGCIERNIPIHPFRDVIALGSVGDDTAGSSSIKWFNMRFLQKFFASINMKYTDAKKSAIAEEFISLEEVSLCKRTWRWEEAIEHYVCPIEIDSISKSIHCAMSNNSKSDLCTTTIQNLDQAIIELSRHTEEVFLKYREIIKVATEKMQWDHMLKHLHKSHRELQLELRDKHFYRIYEDDPDDVDDIDPQSFEPMDTNGCRRTYLRKIVLFTVLVTALLLRRTRGRLAVSIMRPPLSEFDPSLPVNYKYWVTSLNNQTALTGSQREEVLSFSNKTSHWMSKMETSVDPTVQQSETHDSIDGFLNRPIRAYEFEWRPGTALWKVFDPWLAFFEDPRVSNRIAHFKNLRATLRVRFLINGNAFYYGRLIAAYRPLPESDNRTVFRSTVPQDIIEASQRLSVFLNPTDSTGGELLLPFLYPKNYVSIPSGEYSKLGNIEIRDMNTLRHANGSRDPVTVTVFISAEDVDLSTPTSQTPAYIEPQSGEYGRLSGPAHTLANWSGKLSDAPVIGRYARATELIASTVGNVASLFGFSRPRIIDIPQHKLITWPALANTNVADTSQSLALDCKKEVTIDPRVVGLGNVDEMALVPLACKESFLTAFEWDMGAPVDTHLFSIRIGPQQCSVHKNEILNKDEIHMTPSCWVASPFEYWTGSMKIRFQMVASKYHKGRLRFVWDPDHYDDTKRSDFNLNYSEIVDISDTDDFSIKVGWGQDTNYRRCRPIPSPQHSFDPFVSTDQYANGTLSVYIVNKLTAPNPDAEGVSVNVFTSMCEDFEVNALSDNLQRLKLLEYEVQDPGDDIEVDLKECIPQAVLYGNATFGDQSTVILPQATTVNNFGERCNVGARNYTLLTYGQLKAGNVEWDLEFKFTNPSAVACNCIVTVGGIYTGEAQLAGNIGAEATVIVRVPIAPGKTLNAVKMEFPGAIGRIMCDYIKVPLPVSWSTKILKGVNLLNITSGASLINESSAEFVTAFSGDFFSIKMPADRAEGTDTFISLRTYLDNPPYSRGNEPYETNQMPIIKLGQANTVITREAGFPKVWALYYIADDDITPQSGEIESEVQDNPTSAPVTCYMGPPCVSGPTNQVFFGEQVASWRQVLKRYIETYSWSNTTQTGGSVFLPHFPSEGEVTGGTVGFTIHNNSNRKTLFNWVASAYIARRGSMRYKFIHIERHNNAIAATRIPVTDARAAFSVSDIGYLQGTLAGSCTDTPWITSGLEVEMPWYSLYRFYPSRTTSKIDKNNFVQGDQLAFRPNISRGAILSAIGEDFAVMGFVCTPIVATNS